MTISRPSVGVVGGSERFLEKLAVAFGVTRPADPGAPDTALGPLSSSAAAERIERQVRAAVEEGAQVIVGGGRDGNYFEPTILAGLDVGASASQEEFFGPVAQVYRVASEDEAIAVANNTPFGLGAYVITTDLHQAERVADRLDAGMVFINAISSDGPQLPFGGVKRSGFGRELGLLGADEFVNKKLIRTAPAL